MLALLLRVRLLFDREVPLWWRLYRLVRPPVDLPRKTDPAEFGGGRARGRYSQGEVERLMCSHAGCGRRASSTWGGCADGNILRPLCAECDIDMNRIVEEWSGDRHWESKLVAYANRVADEIGRRPDVPWLVTAEEQDAAHEEALRLWGLLLDD